AGLPRLLHLPKKAGTSYEAAAKVGATNSIVAGLIAFGAPIIDRESPAPAPVVLPRDNTTPLRAGNPGPERAPRARRGESPAKERVARPRRKAVAGSDRRCKS